MARTGLVLAGLGLAIAVGAGAGGSRRDDDDDDRPDPRPGPRPTPGPSSPGIIDRTAFAPSDLQWGDMDPIGVTLHATSFSRGSDPTRYDGVRAHFVVLPDGHLVQLHPIDRKVKNAWDFDRHIQIEVVGNFPSRRHKWRAGGKVTSAGECESGCHYPTQEQVDALRWLLIKLEPMLASSSPEISAHRQSNENRTNDPGPEIWWTIGEWSKRRGWVEASVRGTGSPILAQWREPMPWSELV